MKIVANMSLLIGSTLTFGADTAVAQCRLSRPIYRRVVIAQPTYVTSRPVITFGGFSHVGDLAVEVEQYARDILWEMHINYTRNPGFDATYAEAYDILRQARAVHDADHRGNRAEIARVVGDLDRLFHHVEDGISTWQPLRHHFSTSNSLFDKMEAMEVTLHHLMQDVGVTPPTGEPPLPSLNSDPPLPSLSSLQRP